MKTQLQFSELPNLWRPKTLNEKLLANSLSDRRDVLVQTADKAAVRGYVAERVGEDVLPELIYIGPNLERFDSETVRIPVVVKATHASGADWLRLVPEPALADWAEIRGAAEAMGRHAL